MIKSKKREEFCSIKSFSLFLSRNHEIQVQNTIQDIEKWIYSFKDMDFKIQTLNIINNSIVITYSYKKISFNEKKKKLKMELEIQKNKLLQNLFKTKEEKEIDKVLLNCKEFFESQILKNKNPEEMWISRIKGQS